MLNLNVLLEWFGTFLRANPERMTLAFVRHGARVELEGCEPPLESDAGKRRVPS